MTAYSKNGIHALHIHIPKTGGLSIAKLFEKNGFHTSLIEFGPSKELEVSLKKCTYQHMHAEMLEAILNLSVFQCIFAVVRHPLARLKSAYQWNTFHKPIDIEVWVAEILEQYKENPFVLDNHIRPQHEFLMPGILTHRQEDGLGEALLSSIEDRIGLRFETRNFERFNDISSHAGIQSSEITISPESKRKVETFYAKDYELLGY